MPYMGLIRPHSDVGVRLLCAVGNTHTARLWVSTGYGPLDPVPAGIVVEPGRSRAASINTGSGGMLRIHVHFADGRETAELEVRVNGAVRDVALIRNELWWVYSIEEPSTSVPVLDMEIASLTGLSDSRRTPRR